MVRSTLVKPCPNSSLQRLDHYTLGQLGLQVRSLKQELHVARVTFWPLEAHALLAREDVIRQAL